MILFSMETTSTDLHVSNPEYEIRCLNDGANCLGVHEYILYRLPTQIYRHMKMLDFDNRNN